MVDFGYSPCPNDTYMFWAWAHGMVGRELEIAPRLADIQELNAQALGEAPLPLTKISVPAYFNPIVAKRYRLLSVGAALGRGCGPLVVGREAWSLEAPRPLRVAVPGRDTTAFSLARMAIGPWVTEWVELRYDQIMPAVLSGAGVDAGVIIHESRFTYAGLGLTCMLDLGRWWEEKTSLPLPLGVMVASREMDTETVDLVERILPESIALAREAIRKPPDDPLAGSLWTYLRANAIELDDHTIRSHIDLYVTGFSSELGQEGREALSTFARLSRNG